MAAIVHPAMRASPIAMRGLALTAPARSLTVVRRYASSSFPANPSAIAVRLPEATHDVGRRTLAHVGVAIRVPIAVTAIPVAVASPPLTIQVVRLPMVTTMGALALITPVLTALPAQVAWQLAGLPIAVQPTNASQRRLPSRAPPSAPRLATFGLTFPVRRTAPVVASTTTAVLGPPNPSAVGPSVLPRALDVPGAALGIPLTAPPVLNARPASPDIVLTDATLARLRTEPPFAVLAFPVTPIPIWPLTAAFPSHAAPTVPNALVVPVGPVPTTIILRTAVRPA